MLLGNNLYEVEVHRNGDFTPFESYLCRTEEEAMYIKDKVLSNFTETDILVYVITLDVTYNTIKIYGSVRTENEENN